MGPLAVPRPRAPRAPPPVAPALAVAWNLSRVEEPGFLDAMSMHRPGWHLFVHAGSWTEPFPYAPDATTFLCQAVTSSWSGGARRYDPEKQELETVGPDERSDAEIAAEIVAAQITNPSASSVDAVVAVARALDTVVPQRGGGFGRTSGPRLRQRPGGPVASARFT